MCKPWSVATERRKQRVNAKSSAFSMGTHTHTGPHFQERLLCGGVKRTSCFFPKHKTLIRLVWFAGFVRIAVLFVVKLHSRCLLDSFNGNGYVFEGVQLSLLSTAWRNDTIWRENPDICRKKTLNGPPFRKQNRQFARAGYSCTTPVLTIDTSQTKVSRENWTRLDGNSCGG